MIRILWKDRKRASCMRDQIKVEDVLITIKRIWAREGLIMPRTNNRCTKRVYEWQLKESKRSQCRQSMVGR